MSAPRGSGGLDDLFEAAGKRSGEHRTLIVLGVVGLAFTLILAAFVAGRGLAERSSETDGRTPPGETDARSLAEAALGATPSPQPSASPETSVTAHTARDPATAPGGRLTGRPYRGPVRPVAVSRASASCRAAPSVDSAGNRVSYHPRNMVDDARNTAWRCPGNGRGVTLQIRLKRAQRIAVVGLVPGYAKTDPLNGVDRYAQNRRIAAVRWEFPGGAWVQQQLDTDRTRRRMQTVRIPPVRAKRVRLVIEDSVRGKRNLVAVSGVRLARPRG